MVEWPFRHQSLRRHFEATVGLIDCYNARWEIGRFSHLLKNAWRRRLPRRMKCFTISLMRFGRTCSDAYSNPFFEADEWEATCVLEKMSAADGSAYAQEKSSGCSPPWAASFASLCQEGGRGISLLRHNWATAGGGIIDMGHWLNQTADQDRRWPLPSSGRPFSCRFGDAWCFYHPVTDMLVVVNSTAKMVWDMLNEGYEHRQIATAFSRHFNISHEQAAHDVERTLIELESALSSSDFNEQRGISAPPVRASIDPSTVRRNKPEDCGTFRFGNDSFRVISSVAGIDKSYFARFKHRSIASGDDVDTVDVSADQQGCRVTFRGKVIAEAMTTDRLMTVLVEFLLSLEHPKTALLAYCHAAAVCRGDHSLLMPGASGMGKSTLAAFLLANKFSYLGDDVVAIGEDEQSLFPLPTALSIKSGSWPVLEHLYPDLPQLPTYSRYGRTLRYVEPQGNYNTIVAARTPGVILLPAYDAGGPTRVSRLSPMQTMIRLLQAHAALSYPATERKLGKFLRFVEQTPAYELRYSQLPGALEVIENLLATRQ